MTWAIHHHDVQATPWPLEDESVQCVVTSPGAAASESRYRYAFSGAPVGLAEPDGSERMRPEGMRSFTGFANARTVWQIATEPFPDAHFATLRRGREDAGQLTMLED